MMNRYTKTLRASAAAVSLATVFAGCSAISFSASKRPLSFRTGTETENTDLFINRSDFEARAARVHNGMTPEQVFGEEGLNLDAHRFRTLADTELMDAAYAGARPQPHTDQDLEKIMALINRTSVYRMNFKNIENSAAPGIDISNRSAAEGFNGQLTLIFQDGQLVNGDKILSGSKPVNDAKVDDAPSLIGSLFSTLLHGGAKMFMP
jgi:hypothetical protein